MSKASPHTRKFNIPRAMLVFCALFGIAIPWWWRWFPELGASMVLGTPLWFSTSVAGSVVISVVTLRMLGAAWSDLEQQEADRE